MNIIPLDLATLIKERDIEGIAALVISKTPSVLAAIAIIVVGFIISNFIGKLVVKGLQAKGVDASIHSFIRTIITLLLKLVFILSALSTLNVDVNSFVTALGAAGVTAGIGLQSSISQLASGVQILVNHPFKAGDYVDLGSVCGTVQEIKMMYTVFVTTDNKRVIVPNSTITASNIINYNAENRRRIDLSFAVSYDTDISKAREAILDVVKGNNLIFTEPAPVVAVKEHGASAIVFTCLIWCSTNDYWDIYYYMQEGVKLSFDKNGIEIPYNQLDVHVVKE